MQNLKKILFTGKTVALLAVILAGCSPAGQPLEPETAESQPTPEGETPDLLGSDWLLAEINGSPALEEAAVTLIFPNPNELAGNAGCNNYFAVYNLSGEAFSLSAVGLERTSTETMGCDVPESLFQQEETYFEALENTASIQLEGDHLELLDTSGQRRLIFDRKKPVVVDPALLDAVWTLTSLNEKPVLPGTYISLEFDEGSAGGSAGCNGFGADLVAANEGRLLVSGIMSTLMLCQRDDGVDVMQQEADFLEALKNVARYQIVEGQMQVFDASGTRILVYTAQEHLPMDPAGLPGTSWQLLSLDGSPPLEGSQPSLAFLDRERVNGNAGCRDFSGAYQADGDRIRFPEIAMVQNDCLRGEAFQSLEGQFTDALTWANRYLLEPDRLVIYTSRGEELEFGPHPGDAADVEAGPAWLLAAFVEGESETGVLQGSEISLQFEGAP